jgi:RNA polymerase sigma factor (sigma-70 family)
MNEPNPTCDLECHSEIQDDAPGPEEVHRLRERSEILNAAFLGLRPRARKVVELFKLLEHSVTETAQILGISTATVKSRMFHARVALHRMPLLQNVVKSDSPSVR